MSILVALLYGPKSITPSKGSKMPGISARSLRRYAAAGSIAGVSESALKVGGCRVKVFNAGGVFRDLTATGGETEENKKSDRPFAPAAAINHSMTTVSDTQWPLDGTLAAANLQGGYANHCDQVQPIKTEFKRVANSLARLGCKGRKEDVTNLMVLEIGDLRRAIALAAANSKEVDLDEVR
jgi:hypothetical protein